MIAESIKDEITSDSKDTLVVYVNRITVSTSSNMMAIEWQLNRKYVQNTLDESKLLCGINDSQILALFIQKCAEWTIVSIIIGDHPWCRHHVQHKMHLWHSCIVVPNHLLPFFENSFQHLSKHG